MMNRLVRNHLKLILIIVFIFSGLNWSCHKDTRIERNYFAFGSAFGLCGGNCANFYMIEGDDLYEDDTDFYAWDKNIKFKTSKHSQSKIQVAKKLQDNFPVFLSLKPESNYRLSRLSRPRRAAH